MNEYLKNCNHNTTGAWRTTGKTFRTHFHMFTEIIYDSNSIIFLCLNILCGKYEFVYIFNDTKIQNMTKIF